MQGSLQTSSRETNLVVEALRAFLSGQSERLRSALVEPLDWARIEHIANSHSVTALVAYALDQFGGNSLPLQIREQFQNRLLHVSRKNLVLVGEWCRVLEALRLQDIAVISLKGPVLALLNYPNFALREFNDIDLLVHPNDIPKAWDILIASGYEACSPLTDSSDAVLLRSRNSQLDLIHSKQHIRVDLHWGAWHVMFPFQMPVNLLFESARQEQYGAITFLAPAPEHLLLYLCAHGTKHCWRSLRWLCDIACHLHASPNLDWQSCFHSAEAWHCDLVLKHSLLLVHRALGLDLPPSLWNYCSCREAHKLADAAMSLLLREDRDLAPDEELRFHLAFTEGWRNRIRFIFERLFVPDEPGLFEQHLPGSLRFLGYTVKPTRFVFLHLRRLVGETI